MVSGYDVVGWRRMGRLESQTTARGRVMVLGYGAVVGVRVMEDLQSRSVIHNTCLRGLSWPPASRTRPESCAGVLAAPGSSPVSHLEEQVEKVSWPGLGWFDVLQ